MFDAVERAQELEIPESPVGSAPSQLLLPGGAHSQPAGDTGGLTHR